MMTTLIVVVFVLGYIAIALEHDLKVNKTAPALIIGVLTWVIFSYYTEDKAWLNLQLIEHLGDISSILFFLLGAMTIVELIDTYDGFELITKKIRQTDKRKLLWIVSFFTFFLSAILDNLTTTIVMVSLLRKLIGEKKDRLFFTGMIVIAANAGGAWTPIGDVTTTMLWIGGQISTESTMKYLFLPMMFPTAMSLFFLIAATTEVASSGNEVPAATMVNPISVWLTPRADAMSTALSTTKRPPMTSRANPSRMNPQIFRLL